MVLASVVFLLFAKDLKRLKICVEDKFELSLHKFLKLGK